VARDTGEGSSRAHGRTIAVFTGPTQYGTGAGFLDRLMEAWRYGGHHVIEVPAGEGFTPALRAAVSARASLYFGYNAASADLAVRNGSIFALTGARYLAWLVDHPVHHAARLRACPPSAMVATVDQTHARAISSVAPACTAASWIPHFGCDAPATGAPRDIDVLVPGTVRASAAIRSAWRAQGRAFEAACHAAADRVQEPCAHDLLDAATECACQLTGVTPGGVPAAGLAIAVEVDGYVRARRRERVFEGLSALGIRATVCGQAD